MRVKRTLSDKQKRAMIRRKERIAQLVASRPSVTTTFDPPYRTDERTTSRRRHKPTPRTSRPDRPQVVAMRDLAKNHGKRGYNLTPTMAKKISAGLDADRQRMFATEDAANALIRYMHRLGQSMVQAIRERIERGAGLRPGPTDKDGRALYNTGSMLRALTYALWIPGTGKIMGHKR